MYTELKNLRMSNNLTQGQLADFLHVDQRSVKQFESGMRCMSVRMENRLCDLFGCTLEYLVG